MVSGGFDPLHIGHVRLIRAAACLGRVYVALNSDAWLARKKGYIFMPWHERREILEALGHVACVVSVLDEDGTVAKALLEHRPAYFVNGGDRRTANPLEHAVCVRLGIAEIFGAGGDKVQSSSDLVRRRME